MPERFSIVVLAARSDAVNIFMRLLDGIKQFSRRKGEQNGKWADFSQHCTYLQMDAEKEKNTRKIAEVVKAKEKRIW